jgi:iron complex transport system substrate-binding protein
MVFSCAPRAAVRRFVVMTMLAAGLRCEAAEPATHVVTDMSGTTVVVPRRVDRIAEQFPAHTVTDIMLGVGEKLVAIPQNVRTIPLLRKIFPPIAAVPELFRNGGVNMEDLLALQPDLVSALDGGAVVKPFQTAGIPAVVMLFNTMDGLPRSITLAGDVYGAPAVARGKEFVRYFSGRLDFIRTRLENLPAGRRPSVVHISSYPPLVIDGGPSLIGEWIRLGGGRDAARPVSGTHVSITLEQLLAWNPDILIIQTPGGDQGLAANSGQSVIDDLAKAPGWQQLHAVANHRVYVNPQGMYPWDRFGPEEALQIQWVAKTLHPDRFTDLDMRAEAKGFYQNFFGYALSDAELDQIFQVGR